MSCFVRYSRCSMSCFVYSMQPEMGSLLYNYSRKTQNATGNGFHISIPAVKLKMQPEMVSIPLFARNATGNGFHTNICLKCNRKCRRGLPPRMRCSYNYIYQSCDAALQSWGQTIGNSEQGWIITYRGTRGDALHNMQQQQQINKNNTNLSSVEGSLEFGPLYCFSITKKIIYNLCEK